MPSPAASGSALSAEILAQLADLAGIAFDHDSAERAVRKANQDEDEPLSRLISAGAGVHLEVTPARKPLVEALWLAHHATPVVFWSDVENDWITVTTPGWFRVRVVDEASIGKRRTITRAELMRRLGLGSTRDLVEFAVVHRKRPLESASSAQAAPKELEPDGHGHGDDHGHGHHHSRVRPEIRFLRLLHGERRDILTLLLFAIFSGFLYLAAPLAIDAMVSNLAFGAQTAPYLEALVILAIALIAALTIQAIINVYQYVISDVIQRRIFVRTATDLAHRLPRVKATSLDDVHAPELVNRFLDVVTVQKSTALLLLEGINLLISSIIGMVLFSLFNPLLFIFAVLFLISVIVTTLLLGRGAVASSIAESRVKFDMVNWFEEIAAFPFAFKGPGGYAMARETTNRIATEYVACRSRHFRIFMRQVVGLLGISVLANATLLVLGGWLVISQQLTLGQFVASELIFGSIIVTLGKVGKKLEAWYDAMAAMDKLGHIIDLEVEREDGESPRRNEGGLEVKGIDLGFGYEESGPLFEHLSFTIHPSTRAAIIGPHGSGATSLLDLLFGLREPGSGHVAIDGLDLRNWSLESLRERVQLLRRDEIVGDNIVENLRLGRPEIGMDEIQNALDRVGLLDTLLSRPQGLKLHLKTGGAPLSANQRTRLLFARALAQQPRLLLVDEIFDGLDEDSFQILTRAVLDKSLPWTVIIATRDLEVASRCEQIINLGHGHRQS
jgi:ABC-type bacteriocin/lantibiotic exporter with double-glycine peptidase domain